ncbi:hypothetical protein BIW11_01005 [Tropilaelaps mercedesae]|uniref:TIR domain-containing protein n=1 Tax=Tropilaelaps mercedesae TaxID=418985 RepID=A0A1V9XL33_9ACAR|nr:hypothetical protein BIW11_01005 [Tropilaelaps mercedesae]
MRQIEERCRLFRRCGSRMVECSSHWHLVLFFVLLAVLPANTTRCPSSINLPGYACKCNEHIERWIAECMKSATIGGSGYFSGLPATAATLTSTHSTDEVSTTSALQTTATPTTTILVSSSVLEKPVVDAADSPDASDNNLSTKSVDEKESSQPSSNSHNIVENRVKGIGDSRGYTKRDETQRVAHTELNRAESQVEHLVKLQVHGVRVRRARPSTNLYARVYDEKMLKPAFTIEYYPGIRENQRRSLVVICGTSTMEIAGFMNYIDVELDSFSFRYCPMPENITYADMLRENEVKDLVQLSIDHPKLQSPTLSKKPFKKLSSSLKELHITYSDEMETPLLKFEDDFFADFANLEQLSLRSNALTDIQALKLVPQLKELSLGGNPLGQLNDSTFADLGNLTWLQLIDCNIRKISPNAFSRLSKLEQLNLSLNYLTSIPPKVLSNCRSLRDLAFDSNNLTSGIPKDLLDGLNNLNEFSCKSCHLPSLPRTIFHGVPKMRTLRLSNNRIEELHKDTFANLHQLVTLSMPNNDLVSLANGTFESVIGLETLVLAGNDLTVIPDGIFSNNGRLREINLNENHIETLPEKLLEKQANLQVLKLSGNKLTNVPGEFLRMLKDVREIHLYNNSLTTMPLLYEYMRFLKTVDLSSNKIRHLSMLLISSPSLVIDLSGNPIETVKVLERNQSAYFFKDARRTDFFRQYLLDSRDFRCDCHLLDFHEYLLNDNRVDLGVFDKSKLFCSTGQRIARMEAEDFVCELARNDSCPSACRCFTQPSHERIVVNCVNSGLESIERLPINVTNLELENNNLTKVPDLSIYSLLRAVNLSSNHIRDISGFLMSVPPQLERASFRNNSINMIDPMAITKKLINFDLELSGNQFKCDCDTLSLKSFLTNNNRRILDSAYVVCSKPFIVSEGRSETRLNEIEREVICPYRVLAQQQRTRIYLGTTIALSALVILAIVVYYKNKRRIQIYLYIYVYDVYVFLFGTDEVGKEKKYDAFISYSEHDRAVMEAILEEFERKDPETGIPEFKFCVHGRDFAPTYPIVYNILNSVQNSRRTILVLSEKFVESTYFNVEFRTALSEMLTNDKTHRLIIVLKGEKPPIEKMDQEFRKIVVDFTYIQWGSPHFWNHLRYALPHKRPRRKRHGSRTRDMLNELDHPLHVFNRHPKPTAAEVARMQEQLENERNRLETSTAMASTGGAPSTFGRSSIPRESGNSKILTGQINSAFESLSTEDISVHCDSFRSNRDVDRTSETNVIQDTSAQGTFKPVSARHHPKGVSRPSRRKDKDSSDA